MTSPCRDFRDALLEAVGDLPSPSATFAHHLASCPDCAATLVRQRRLAGALRSLERVSVPPALDGSVVAATQAGQRQDRVLTHLRLMLRHQAPARLDEQLARPRLEVARLRAPQVLERLVDEELRDPSRALARRYVSRLGRVRAPDTLRERVALLWDAPPRSMRGRFALAAAAALLLCAGLWTWLQLGRGTRSNEFEVEFVDDLNQLDPVARELLYGVTGGWSELRDKERL